MPGRLHGRGFWRPGANSPHMHEMLYLIAGWALGLVLCVMLTRAIVLRWRLPWRATLMYFGLLPYPDEVLLRARRRRRPAR